MMLRVKYISFDALNRHGPLAILFINVERDITSTSDAPPLKYKVEEKGAYIITLGDKSDLDIVPVWPVYFSYNNMARHYYSLSNTVFFLLKNISFETKKAELIMSLHGANYATFPVLAMLSLMFSKGVSKFIAYDTGVNFTEKTVLDQLRGYFQINKSLFPIASQLQTQNETIIAKMPFDLEKIPPLPKEIAKIWVVEQQKDYTFSLHLPDAFFISYIVERLANNMSRMQNLLLVELSEKEKIRKLARIVSNFQSDFTARTFVRNLIVTKQILELWNE